jgi:NAD(P)-dependent dehydrogenase (short-subunit alcohol dehydrogenase family)
VCRGCRAWFDDENVFQFGALLELPEGEAVQLSLADRTILVTGGGSGIGKGVAAAVVAAGGNAMIVGRNADRLAAAADEIRAQAGDGAGSVRYEPADVTSEDEVAAVVEATTAWHGRLHGVVHCAGGSETIGPITQVDSDAWRRTVDLNVNGSMYVLKHSARELVRGGGGSFVGISSIAASNTHRWFGAYGVSKSALDHLMMLAADELGASWVRVNCIRPGLIRTDLVAPILDSPEISGDYASCTPLPRPGEVDDIANTAVFLLSDLASWITGQVINVDGGHSLRRGPDMSSMLEPVFGADALRGVVS